MNRHLSSNGESYASYQMLWEKSASIRSRPRRILGDVADEEQLYPVARQPLCFHPLVNSLGREAIRFILTQSLYKFLSDIAFIETEVVNQTAFKISNNKFHFHFPGEIRKDALLIMIDESYHAYVALDFMKQVEEHTGIKPIALPVEIELTRAMKLIMSRLPEEYYGEFEVISVCIAENSLTKELIGINREKHLHKTYDQINSDHMCDEVRHSMIFTQILKILWSNMDEFARAAVGPLLPDFVRAYLKSDLQKNFDREILRELNLGESEIEEVIADTHIEKSIEELKLTNPIIDNIVKLFESTGILDDAPTKQAFLNRKLLSER
jgi:hypothetical protein